MNAITPRATAKAYMMTERFNKKAGNFMEDILKEIIGPAVSSTSEMPKRASGIAINAIIVYRIDHQRYLADIFPIQRDPWTTGYRVIGITKKRTIPKELNITCESETLIEFELISKAAVFTCRAAAKSPLAFANAAMRPVIVVPRFAPAVMGYARSTEIMPIATIGVKIDRTIELD